MTDEQKYRRAYYLKNRAKLLARAKARNRAVTVPCGCGCGTIVTGRKQNRPLYVLGHHQRGAKNPRWNGGRSLMTNGYIIVIAPEGHPGANKYGRIYEHRLVAEQTLGRYLTKSEVVHHVNGVKADNRPENIVVCATQGDHIRLDHPRKRARKQKPSPS